MDDTVPAQLDTIIGQIGALTGRLADSDKRMDASDQARNRMIDQLGVHGIQLTAQSQQLDEQSTQLGKHTEKLDALSNATDEIQADQKKTIDTIGVVTDILTTGRTLKNGLLWVSAVLGGIAGIWAAFSSFHH